MINSSKKKYTLKKQWKKALYFLSIFFSVFILLYFLYNFFGEKMDTILFINIMLIIILVPVALTIIYIFIFESQKKNIFGKYSDDIIINKLATYSQKRKEIDQEMDYLTKQLIESDAAQYLDMNRLIFLGQNKFDNNSLFNYELFLKQFGIEKKDLKIEKNKAVFLTPFNEQGTRTFYLCSDILGSVGIFLQKTDNIVHKDDILMNVILLIIQSEWIIVNIDGRNPNVYYELGIAHAIGKKTIIISQSKYSSEDINNQDIGFDIRQRKIIIYKDEMDLKDKLINQIARMKN